jgi:integrase
LDLKDSISASIYDIVQFLIKRKRKASAVTANKDLRLLRAAFNWGKNPKRGYVSINPCDGVDLFPVEKHKRYVPPKSDVLKVISAAETNDQDYLWTIALTLARMSEVNRLRWEDVDFNQRTITLYTRKKKGGHLTPSEIKMSDRLHGIMVRRYLTSPSQMSHVFWRTKWSHKQRMMVSGPYSERHKLIRTLCKKAGVRYFRFHPLRHFGATMMDQSNVPIGDIQKILGHENREATEI